MIDTSAHYTIFCEDEETWKILRVERKKFGT